MKKALIPAIVSIGLLLPAGLPARAETHHYHQQQTHREYVKHKRHMKTAKRVGVGAAGGAAIGALAGGAKGAGIGALAGAGAGALYDAHQKHHGHY